MKKNTILDIILRNGIIVILFLLTLGALLFNPEILWTVYYIILGESLALFLSGIAQYTYTHIKFIKQFEDSEPLVKIANAIILSSIFLGVHFLVGYAMYGIYLANGL